MLLSSIILCAQQVESETILSVNSYERNAKTILFEKKISDNNITFILKAENQSSKDFTKCKWISSFSKEEIMYFVDILDGLEVSSSVESSLFNVVSKKKKIKVEIKNTKCTSQHKTYYFQESCKRVLSFVFLSSETPKIVEALKKSADSVVYARKL